MRIKIEYGLLLIVFLLSSYLIYTYVGEYNENSFGIEKITNDEKVFKKEYESLNGKTNDQGKLYVQIEVPENNHMKYSSEEEIIKLLQTGTGIIYFGFPECPWCRNIVPILSEVVSDNSISTIYYLNALSIRDKKHLDENGNIVTDKEGTQNYYKIVELLSGYLGSYETLNDESIKRLYFPTVVFIKEGKIKLVNISTVPTQLDPYTKLTEEEKNELYSIYEEGINSIYENTCDESC